MARKNSVTAENLAALGAERPAALLMELAEGNAVVRKRLVLALAERGGPASLIKAVDRRLAALASAYGEIPWEKEKTYAAEIDGQRGVVMQSLAPVDAPAAAERLGRLIRLAPAVLRRVDDSSARFDDIFRTAVADLGAVWGLIEGPDPEAPLADRRRRRQGGLPSGWFRRRGEDRPETEDQATGAGAPVQGIAALRRRHAGVP